MLEVLTALGLASNVAQLVGLGASLVKNVDAIFDSAVHNLPENGELLKHVQNYNGLQEEVESLIKGQQALQTNEQALADSAKDLHNEVDSLVADLEDLRVTPSANKVRKALSGARQTIQTHRKGSQLQKRQQKLSELTNILGTNLLLVLEKKSDTRLNQLGADLKRVGIKTSQDIQQRSSTVHRLVEDHEQLEAKEGMKRIHSSLLYDSMEYRRDIIAERHRQTFEWCFRRDATPLQAWLETGKGVFWVCGRAGSGKSTLMKFLASHRETQQALKVWSGTWELLIDEHFFYYAERI